MTIFTYSETFMAPRSSGLENEGADMGNLSEGYGHFLLLYLRCPPDLTNVCVHPYTPELEPADCQSSRVFFAPS